MASTIRNLQVTFGGTVSFPAALRKASEKQDVTFDRAVKIEDADGVSYERIMRSERTASGVAAVGSASPDTNIVRGVWSGDEFHEIDQHEIDKIALDTQIDDIAIEEFVPVKNVPFYRAQGAYYLTPQKGLIGAKQMRLLRDALKAEKLAGVAKIALKGTGGRQKLAVIHEHDGRLLVSVLAFASDFRDADESASVIENVEVNRAHLAMARKVLKANSAPSSKTLDEAVDDAVVAREKLYADAVEGQPAKAVTRKREAAQGTDDIMAALEASIEAVSSRKAKATA